MAEPSTAQLGEYIKDLKAITTHARQAMRAIGDLKDALSDPELTEALAARGLRVVFVDKAETEEGQSHE